MKARPILPGAVTAGHSFLDALAADEPLAERIVRARAQPDPRVAHLSYAILAALLGDAHGSEVALTRARRDGPDEPDHLLEAARAFVLVETGHPARAMLHLDRAREAPGSSQTPADASFLLLLRAQALFAGHGLTAARAAAAEAQSSVPADECALRTYASIVCASLALEDRDHDAAERDLALASDTPSGILAARIDVLRARLRFAQTADPRSSALDLDRAINRLTVMGARRDLALAYLERALQAGFDPGGSPGRWLTRAHSLLAGAGDQTYLQALRRPVASMDRRLLHRTDSAADAAVDALRQRRNAPKGVVRNRPLPWPEGQPSQNDDDLQGAVLTISQSEEHRSIALEHSIAERTRMGQLAAATHELASIDEYDDLVAAVPRLALVVCPGTAARVVLAREDGALETVAACGAKLAASGPAIAERVREAFPARGSQAAREHSGSDSIAVVVLGPREGRLALVVERDGEGAIIGERDLEQLTLYASFTAVSLVRARSRVSLREAVARDAATLAAIGDGVLVIDRTGIVRSLNQAAAVALGVQRDETIGRRLRDLPRLSPLALALAATPSGPETVPLPHGEVIVRAHAYEGGTVAILRDVVSEHTVAKRAVGSTARFTFERLIGDDPLFTELIASARRAAVSDLPILITGESGTGKELLAQAIHNASGRGAAPFVGINVTALPRDLVESELFGYEGGTFTGARASGRAGKFELAGRGTLLLDEIGDMPPELQAKLLRVLQEKVVQRLGSVSDVQVRARVIATTHRDLKEGVSLGRFRLDLYHRLRVVHLEIPPLRARRGDILKIAHNQLRAYAEQTGRGPISLSPTVAAAFLAYEWPGNVRELCNVVESEASLLPPGENVISRIPQSIRQATAPRPAVRSAPSSAILSLDEVERTACSDALQRYAGNVTRAAQALGVAKNTLYAKMRRYGLGPLEAARAAATVVKIGSGMG